MGDANKLKRGRRKVRTAENTVRGLEDREGEKSGSSENIPRELGDKAGLKSNPSEKFSGDLEESTGRESCLPELQNDGENVREGKLDIKEKRKNRKLKSENVQEKVGKKREGRENLDILEDDEETVSANVPEESENVCGLE